MTEQNSRLDDWLAAARAEVAQRQPDQLAEQQMLARMREMRALQSVVSARIAASTPVHPRSASRRRWFNWRTAAFVGVMTLVAAMSAVVLLPSAPSRDATVRTPFLALVASESIAAEPSALIVSSEVAGSTLSDYGLPVDPARIDQPVRAEFLLSPTGLLLAVRFAE